MQTKRLFSLFLIPFLLIACSPLRLGPQGSGTIESEEFLPTTELATATVFLTPIKAVPPAPRLTPTQTITPNPTETPPATPTQWGGGKGIVVINASDFLNRNNPKQAAQMVFSLADFQILSDNIPQFQKDPIFLSNKITKQSFLFHYPETGETRKVLECPPEYQRCIQTVLYGSPLDEWVYVSQEYSIEQYSGKITVDLYRVSTRTGTVEKIDTFETILFRFLPFPGSLKGLLSLTGYSLKSELMIYDLETQERDPIASGWGQYLLFGYSPDRSTFFYRITDTCKTEFVAKDGTKIATIDSSNGVIGWLDDERFLVNLAGNNNAPNCTNTGIAIADQHGLTREFITRSRSDFSELSSDGKTLVYTSDCRNQGCKKLMISSVDGRDPQLLYESSQFGLMSYQFSQIFSPDGRNLVFFDRKSLVTINIEQNQLKTIELYDREYDYHVVTFARN